MPRLLHIKASPRGLDSYSTQLAEAFIQAFKQTHPLYGTDELDVFHANLPAFEAPQAAAKYAVMNGQEPTGAAGRAWKAVIEVINDFKSADMYLISSPMWNFSIPYRLKQYIDILVQPGLTFSYSAAGGYKGLVTGKKAFLMLARGGAYPPATKFDMQQPYLEMILQFMGVEEIRAVVASSTLMAGAAEVHDMMEVAKEQARTIAAEA